MRLDEYVEHDGAGLAALIARREVAAREVAEAALAAMDAINPEINAVVERYDDALGVGKCQPGPLHGVPYLVKDVGRHFKGRRAESGSRFAVAM
jgi:amidase